MLVLTGLALLGTTHATWRAAKQAHTQLAEPGISPNIKLGILGPKWRQERNFWIALLCFSSWVTLFRVYHIMLRVLELERRAAAAGAELPPGPSATTGGGGHGGGGPSSGSGKKPMHSSAGDTPSAPAMPSKESKKDT
eukprot:CAMPEP_0117666964 /NCGR_PEP_ID=MMETSP0804-20121206/10681_1 /TAXON_ID=1074897 /ORGANISM="Tetraselmis astigmatica, Strain CCMP880" /LENGTH=137 /DNA_ID=CAMNT_0005474593 /DNA_START=469 /DNA_END=882 /DNA_ORIENTATION=+